MFLGRAVSLAHVSASALDVQKGALEPLELELRALVNFLMRMLGTKLFPRVVKTLLIATPFSCLKQGLTQ